MYRDRKLNQAQVQQDRNNNICDENQYCDWVQKEFNTEERERDTNEEKRDTKRPQRGSSHETIHDVKSISSDSSATLHRESDTFSLTSETLRNTDSPLTERSDDTKCPYHNINPKKVQLALDKCLIETNVFEPNTHKSSENEIDDTDENKLEKTKDKSGNLGDHENTEFGLDKIETILESIGNKSVQETDL